MIHKYKTGALIKSAARIGAILAGATQEEQAAVSEYASEVGLCFQVVDDVLNATSTREELGKSAGSDAEQGKATFVGVFGWRAPGARPTRPPGGRWRRWRGSRGIPRACGSWPFFRAPQGELAPGMKGSPQRLDALLVERGLAESRSRAQGLILSGSVRVGDRVVTKAGSRVAPDEPLAVERAERFVSRAGEKLEGALDEFGIRVEGRLCIDAGASTGGFTDVLLKRGAERVLAVDVGYGQLDWSLRNDPRVVVMERTNVRHLDGDDLPFRPGSPGGRPSRSSL
jgi:hypothetical protein